MRKEAEKGLKKDHYLFFFELLEKAKANEIAKRTESHKKWTADSA